MVFRGQEIVGYVDQPAGTPGGDGDVARLMDAGVLNIRHESDVNRRPVWRETVAACQEGDVLTIVALDRLGRPIRSLLRSIAGMCARGVRFRCLNGGVDIDLTRHGIAQARVIDALVGCLNVWEGGRTRNRGQTMAERGRRPGAQLKLGTASPDAVVEMLRRPGASRASVARQLGVGRTTLYRYLNRNVVSGPGVDGEASRGPDQCNNNQRAEG
jgi:DNA invertase Pin-like site-specific DNA recombinase